MSDGLTPFENGDFETKMSLSSKADDVLIEDQHDDCVESVTCSLENTSSSTLPSQEFEPIYDQGNGSVDIDDAAQQLKIVDNRSIPYHSDYWLDSKYRLPKTVTEMKVIEQINDNIALYENHLKYLSISPVVLKFMKNCYLNLTSSSISLQRKNIYSQWLFGANNLIAAMSSSANFNINFMNNLNGFNQLYGYDFVFARELDAIAQEGDLFIPISTSGNSKNIIEAIKVAQQKQLVIYGLTGNKAGVMTQLCDCIEVPSSETPRIQECHILIGHILCQMVEASIFSS